MIIKLLIANLTLAFFSSSLWVQEEPKSIEQLREILLAGDEAEVDATIRKLTDSELRSLIPECCHVLEKRFQSTRWSLLRRLAKIDLQNIPEHQMLCKALFPHLDDSELGVRSVAVECYLRIGENSIEFLRASLQNKSPRVRAATVHILTKLNGLRESEAKLALRDVDARVRFQGVSFFDQNDVAAESMLHCLEDKEPEVIRAAARAVLKRRDRLQVDQYLPQIVKNLANPELNLAMTIFLADLGTDAQSAIPDLLLNARGDWTTDLALEHIGRPRKEDIPLIESLMDHPSQRTTRLAIKQIGLLGSEAASHAESFREIAMHGMRREFTKEPLELPLRHPMALPEFMTDIQDEAVLAYWRVTHDENGTIELIQSYRIPLDAPTEFGDAWNVMLLKMLRSSVPTTREQAIEWLDHTNASKKQGPSEIFQEISKQFLSGQDEPLRLLYILERLRQDGEPAHLDRMLKLHREKMLETEDLVETAIRLNLSSPELIRVLRSEQRDREDEVNVQKSIELALWMFAGEPLLNSIDIPTEFRLPSKDSIGKEKLWVAVRPIVVEKLHSTRDYPISQAVRIAEHFGPTAIEVLPQLELSLREMVERAKQPPRYIHSNDDPPEFDARVFQEWTIAATKIGRSMKWIDQYERTMCQFEREDISWKTIQNLIEEDAELEQQAGPILCRGLRRWLYDRPSDWLKRSSFKRELMWNYYSNEWFDVFGWIRLLKRSKDPRCAELLEEIKSSKDAIIQAALLEESK